jgi:hypothetical protein
MVREIRLLFILTFSHLLGGLFSEMMGFVIGQGRKSVYR